MPGTDPEETTPTATKAQDTPAPEKAAKKKPRKPITPQGRAILAGIVGLYAGITGLMFLAPPPDALDFVVRWAALAGFASLWLSSILSNYMREIYTHLGAKFLKIHHAFAIAGIVLVTLHPVAFAIEVANAAVFVPDVSSWGAFWALAGRPALYLIYVATAAAILRRKIGSRWRAVHMLMYVALLFALVHAIIIGTDFSRDEGVVMIILFAAMFTTALLVFVTKRRQARERKLKRQRHAATKKPAKSESPSKAKPVT